MDKLEMAFHLSIAAVVTIAVGLVGYSLFVVSIVFMKVIS